jgi:hypothetical protein
MESKSDGQWNVYCKPYVTVEIKNPVTDDNNNNN